MWLCDDDPEVLPDDEEVLKHGATQHTKNEQ
jgi:hypothetical protein